MKKIAFIGHDLKFIDHIIDYFKKNLNYEVRIDKWEGHELHDEVQSLEIINWADILFCEWGLGNVLWYQAHKKDHQKLFVRLHRFEMNTEYPAKFDYGKIDKLIAVSPFIYEEFHRVSKVPREKMTVIFNAVDTKRFERVKLPESNFNLGMIGYVPKLKRIDRAIDIFEKLYEKDKRYKLFIKGRHPKEYSWLWNDEKQRKYYEELFEKIKRSPFSSNIHFEGWGDVSEWLEKIGYVLSVSDYESFHLAPIEGIASGAYPLVLEREGVNTIFPNEIVFSHHEGIVDFVLNNKEENLIQRLRDFVKQNYSLERICMDLNKIFTI